MKITAEDIIGHIRKTPKERQLKNIFTREIQPYIERASELARRDMRLLGYPIDAYPILEKYLDGVQPGFCLWGGISQSSKTMNMLNLLVNTILSSPDLVGIYFSIDDDFNTIYYRLLALLSGIPINDVSLIKRYIKEQVEKGLDTEENIMKRYTEAESKLKTLSHRLFIFDSNKTIQIEEMIEMIASFYDISMEEGNENLIIGIDNFHLLEFKDEKLASLKETAKVNKMSHLVKREIVNRFKIPVHVTVELRKLNHVGPPDLDALKDAVALRYDANLVNLVHNDSVSKLGETIMFWKYDDDGKPITATEWIMSLGQISIEEKKKRFLAAKDNDEFMPIILLIISKNKLSGREGRIFYALDNNIATLIEFPEIQQRILRSEVIAYELNGQKRKAS